MDFVNIKNFQTKLNSNPPKDALMEKQGVKYLPISYVEMTLDEMYFGLWKTDKEQSKIVANEILVTLELHVFHPIQKVWLTRIGCGASMIMQSRGSQISDINAKLKNTLQKDYPSAKAEALKNAAKSLGKLFGRDIGRNSRTVHNNRGLISAEKISEIQSRNLTLLAAKNKGNEKD